MGYSSDIMHDFVGKEIKKVFPASDGWRSQPATYGGGMYPGYTLVRRTPQGAEAAQVMVSFAKKVAPAEVAALKSAAFSGGVKKGRRVLLIPQDADTSAVSGEVHLVPMTTFGFREKELVWLNRNVHNPKKAEDKKE
jgi:hypothetical protein